jgi:hypothetical protein
VRLIAIAALVGALALSGSVATGRQSGASSADHSAKASARTVVNDGPTNIEPGCDIRRATSKRTDDGRLRHTITPQAATGNTSVHSIAVSRSRSGGVDLVLERGGDGVHVHLADGGRTFVLIVGRGRVANAVDSERKYFWVARSCSQPGDRAPNPGSKARQSL